MVPIAGCPEVHADTNAPGPAAAQVCSCAAAIETEPIDPLIAAAGFKVDRLQTGYMAGPKLMTLMYEGVASPH